MNGPEWLKPIDAARLLGVSTKDIYRLIDRGELAAYRFGPRLVRLRAADVEEYRHRAGD